MRSRASIPKRRHCKQRVRKRKPTGQFRSGDASEENSNMKRYLAVTLAVCLGSAGPVLAQAKPSPAEEAVVKADRARRS